MDLQFKTFPFQVKAAKPDGSQFEGLVSVFHNIDSYGEIVDDKAFDMDLPDFMSDGFIGGLNHDWDNPIGKPQEGTKVTKEGLHLVGSVLDTTHGTDVRKMLANGVVKKLSIGFRTMGDMWLADEDECMAYWESKGYKPSAQDMARCKSGARVLTRIHLYEGSPVTVPANDLATITAVKAAREAAQAVLKAPPESEPDSSRLTAIKQIESLSDAEDTLRDAGFSRSESKAYISQIKSLLREAASDDQPEEKGEEPAGDSQSDASETPAEETETKQGDAVDPPAPIVTPPLATEDADTETSPYASEKSRWKREANAALYKEHLRITARIIADEARSLGVS